jgi:HlyD family type I secretion membrane fusion protein
MVAAGGRNIHLQHLEGGLISQLTASDGDAVKRGDVILVLDDTVAKAQVNRLYKQWASLSAQLQRLEAERDNLSEFQANLSGGAIAGSIDVTAIAAHENRDFKARLDRYASEQKILVQRLAQTSETARGLESQKAAVDTQLNIVAQEVARKDALLKLGLIKRSEFTELLRIDAELRGQSAALASQQAAAKLQYVETQEQIERQKTQRVEDAVAQLRSVFTSINDLEEQISSAVDVLNRTTVRAPADGIVVTTTYNREGNVIAPGEKIAELLPTATLPQIDIHLKPTDIDVVRIGQKARIRLAALNTRLTPEVEATVNYISADKLIDQSNGEPYYRAILTIGDLPKGLSPQQIYPGMPVEAFIDTGERTFFEYLAKPIIDSAHRAFTED